MTQPNTVAMCHWCGGSGIDDDADAAAAYPRNCPNCHGTGAEPDHEEEEEDAVVDPT